VVESWLTGYGREVHQTYGCYDATWLARLRSNAIDWVASGIERAATKLAACILGDTLDFAALAVDAPEPTAPLAHVDPNKEVLPVRQNRGDEAWQVSRLG
jgi:hypothetical protein